jgi:putative ABC transport system permease protein
LEIEGRPPTSLDERISSLVYRVSPGYFDTMGIPLLAGRDIDRNDRDANLRVVVVSESFATQHLPGEQPLGKRFRFGSSDDAPFWEIVGVVGDVQHYSLGRESMAQLYLPYQQRPDDVVRFVLKSSAAPLSLIGTVRDEVQAVDPDQPLMGLGTMADLFAANLSAPRFRTILLGSFGLTALLLSVVGLYGVLSYSVAQRSREIGMRLALGAQQSAILKLVLRDGVPLVLIGVVIGVAGAFALTRVLASMLFGVGVRDPAVFTGAPLILIVVAMVAVVIPAVRAMRVDPVETLAAE